MNLDKMIVNEMEKKIKILENRIREIEIKMSWIPEKYFGLAID